MFLSELEWRLEGTVMCANFIRPAHTSYNSHGVIWLLADGKTYTIADRRVPPRREWFGVDELTAECILIELTKSPHDAEDHPER